jgi:LysM repeat protein
LCKANWQVSKLSQSLLPTPPKPRFEKEKSVSNIRHTVKSGETLARIAKKHHVTIDAILAVNPALKDPDVIFAGQTILVPVDEPLPAETTPPQPPSTTTPVRGFDASERISSGAACFRNAGFHFAIRYYNIKNSN